jgi:hypothetical protein
MSGLDKDKRPLTLKFDVAQRDGRDIAVNLRLA